jgi:predicted ferric reductase
MKPHFYAYWGWTLVFLFVTIPLVLWASIMPLGQRFNTAYALLGSIAHISAIIGLMLFCLNIILTTRLKFLEDLFGGLNKVYVAHQIVGDIGFLVILLHPLALSLRLALTSPYDAAIFWVPHLNDIPTAFGIIALWLFVGLIIITLYMRLPYNIWLLSHKVFGLVLLVIALHVIFISSDISHSHALKVYLLGFTFLAFIAFVYRTLLPRFFVRHYPYRVSQVRPLASGVVEIALQPKGARLPYVAGQFLFICFLAEGVPSEWHPFTISSNPRDPGVAITVKSLGSYTNKLVILGTHMVGMNVLIEGAYGRFFFRNFKAKQQIWIAGGIGITPFLSMIKDITPDYTIDLYYCVKTDSELVDFEQLKEFAFVNQHNFRLIPVVAERNGFLTVEMVQQVSDDISQSEILLCGPQLMMRALHEQLINQKIKSSAIHSEEFALS